MIKAALLSLSIFFVFTSFAWAQVVEEEGEAPSEDQFMTIEEKENRYRGLNVKRAGKYSFGVSIGIIPDLGNMSSAGPNLEQINNEMERVVSLYNQTSPSAPADFKSEGNREAAAKSAIGIPIGFYFYYTSEFFLVRSGFNYTSSITAVNEFTGSQNSATVSNTSGLFTAGETIRVSSRIKMSYFEIPLTLALRLVNVWGSAIYFGGGPSYFIGGWRRESVKNNVSTVKYTGSLPDVDVFFATALGYHFVIGGEVYINQDIALTAEFIISQGIAGRARDRVVAKSVNVLKTESQESLGIDDPEEIRMGAGGIESGSESAEVQFGGSGLNIGVRYLL